MLKKLSPTTIWKAINSTFLRFPLSLTCAWAASIIGMFYITYEDLFEVWECNNALLTLILGIFLYSVQTLFAENKNYTTKVLTQGFATAFLILFYYFGIPQDYNLAGSSWIFRYIFLIVLLLVGLSWVGFELKEKTKNLKIWEYNRQVWTNMTITFFFGMILFLGVAAGILAIDNLFGIDISERWYARIWLLVAGVFGPTFFLYHFPKNDKTLKTPKIVPHFVNILAKYILAPLVVGYFLILYAYTGEIIITWNWPKNLVTWLVIGFLCVGIFTYGMWTPFFEGKVEKYRRLFWLAFIPQIWVLFCAISIRVAQYSWTENRYTVMMFGLWLLAVSLYFIINKKAQLKYLFASISFVILITQFGPWSIYQVSKNAQIERLDQYLEKHNIEGPVDKKITKEIPLEDLKEISSIVRYLSDRHGQKVAANALKIEIKGDESERIDHWNIASTLMEEIGLRYVSKWESAESQTDYFSISANYRTARNISGFDLQLHTVSDYEISKPLKNSTTWMAYIDRKAQRLKIYKDQIIIDEFDLTKALLGFQKLKTEGNLESPMVITKYPRNPVDPEKLSTIFEGKNTKVKLFFTHISGRKSKVDYFDVEVFITENK